MAVARLSIRSKNDRLGGRNSYRTSFWGFERGSEDLLGHPGVQDFTSLFFMGVFPTSFGKFQDIDGYMSARQFKHLANFVDVFPSSLILGSVENHAKLLAE